MRASTLFALTAAVLIGLGVAVAAKMGGWFGRPVEVAKRPDVMVIAAARNLFAGDTIEANGIRLRAMKEKELEAFNRNPDQFLPPLPSAAVLRVAAKNIEADTPITRDLLKEFSKPVSLNERLLPNMRAINVSLPKDRSAGGLVQVGEWVEVLLTSQISGEGLATTRTAAVAPKVRVIAKRDTLWPVFAPLPKDKPVEYTLEVDAYQAAMIEYSRTKGTLSLTPLPQSEQKKLEAKRNEKLASAANGKDIVLVAGDGATEDEIRLVQATEKGEHTITEQDLVRLFDIKVEPNNPIEPPPATTEVERFVGTRRVDAAIFTLDGKRTSGSFGQHGARVDNAAYPPAPYSSNTDRRGQIIPNNPMISRIGSVGASGSSGRAGQITFRFAQPDCPTCKKNK